MSILRELLQKAVSLEASDVHIKPRQTPFFRAHARLVESGFDVLSEKDIEQIVIDIMPAHLREPFRIGHEADFSHHEEGVGRFRTNVFLAQSAPTIAMRYVKSQIPTVEQLRLPIHLKELARVERGIILLSGTTGSGKSTTLAAIIGEINRTERSRVITIEDPVEYFFDDDQSLITQREVGLDTLGFHEALTRVMRQDPDVILIGEMRDRESIRTAMLAAETGHLVLSTVHSANASIAVPRILDMFPPDEREQMRMAIAENFHAIICQRLMPDVYGGVVPAVEIMINTSTVRKLIERNQLDVLSAAIETGKEDGMQSFNQSIYQLIKAGTITEAEGLRFATNPESLRMNLRGIFLDEGKRILAT